MLILENHCWRSHEILRATARIAALAKMRDELLPKMIRAKTPMAKRDLDIRFDALVHAEVHEKQLVVEHRLDIARKTAPWFEVQQ